MIRHFSGAAIMLIKVKHLIDLASGLLLNTVESLLRGHSDERPPILERPLDNVSLNKCIDFYP